MKISGITYVPNKIFSFSQVIKVTIISVVILVIAGALLSFYIGWKLTHPKKIPLPSFSSNIVPEYKEAVFQDVTKKITLRGWYFQSKDSDKTVILAHGYGRYRLQFDEKTIDIVKIFLSKEYNVLLFDFRSSGISDGNVSTISIAEKDDLLGAVQYVKAQGSKYIALLGYSMGAATSILTAAESTDVNAVIADSPFADLKEYLDKSLPVWSKLPSVPFNKLILFATKVIADFEPSKSSPKSVIANITPRPILFIHSRDDKSISIENSKQLHSIYSKAAGDKSELWETQLAGHVESYEKFPEEYMDRVLKFLDKTSAKSMK